MVDGGKESCGIKRLSRRLLFQDRREVSVKIRLRDEIFERRFGEAVKVSVVLDDEAVFGAVEDQVSNLS
jgi:hypothetical protein